jgi:hypothetical protein
MLTLRIFEIISANLMQPRLYLSNKFFAKKNNNVNGSVNLCTKKSGITSYFRNSILLAYIRAVLQCVYFYIYLNVCYKLYII